MGDAGMHGGCMPTAVGAARICIVRDLRRRSARTRAVAQRAVVTAAPAEHGALLGERQGVVVARRQRRHGQPCVACRARPHTRRSARGRGRQRQVTVHDRGRVVGCARAQERLTARCPPSVTPFSHFRTPSHGVTLTRQALDQPRLHLSRLRRLANAQLAFARQAPRPYLIRSCGRKGGMADAAERLPVADDNISGPSCGGRVRELEVGQGGAGGGASWSWRWGRVELEVGQGGAGGGAGWSWKWGRVEQASTIAAAHAKGQAGGAGPTRQRERVRASRRDGLDGVWQCDLQGRLLQARSV
jgi:hypothetical protein